MNQQESTLTNFHTNQMQLTTRILKFKRAVELKMQVGH